VSGGSFIRKQPWGHGFELPTKRYVSLGKIDIASSLIVLCMMYLCGHGVERKNDLFTSL
jgi:hypothetical protein